MGWEPNTTGKLLLIICILSIYLLVKPHCVKPQGPLQLYDSMGQVAEIHLLLMKHLVQLNYLLEHISLGN